MSFSQEHTSPPSLDCDRSPTHNQSSTPSHDPFSSRSTRLPAAIAIYIVLDTCYPTKASFDTNIGITTVDSAHTTNAAANARAKKIIYENERGCTVDIDKIIEQMRKGLFTGIGLDGMTEKEGCCYARKCEVERRFVDEDSEDEDGEGRGEEDIRWEEDDFVKIHNEGHPQDPGLDATECLKAVDEDVAANLRKVLERLGTLDAKQKSGDAMQIPNGHAETDAGEDSKQ
ncbi:hypothetical protein IQ07DRAFT_638256 [Pyrenochaeta sp. DS3sAY3a]|nr:hypothetical protein IQ07DRAFT_638256 [Pyrenochaeta sp. DS3sAY3a]